MKLNLKKDLIIFDLESTGLSVRKDKIVQIAMLKIFADGRPNELKTKYINPERPIPIEATEVHGITNEMVANEQPFKKYAQGILAYIGDSDIGTFNGNHFDIPMLMEHFEDAGLQLDMSHRAVVDVKRIYHQMERRDLKAAYIFYTGKKMDGAHDAGNDCLATFEVLEAMLDKYKDVDCIDKHDIIIEKPVKNDIEQLDLFTRDFNSIDFQGKFKYDKSNIPVFGFGKYQGQPVLTTLKTDQGYYKWMLDTYKSDFTRDSLRVLNDIMSGKINSTTKEADSISTTNI